MNASLSNAGQEFAIEPFDRRKHSRKGFSSGVDSVDNFLNKTVAGLQDDDLVRCFVAFFRDPEARADILGFYTLHAHVVSLGGVAGIKTVYSSRPATPIVYLPVMGVHRDRQRAGIGRALMLDAFERCACAAGRVGAAFLALDALDEEAAKFYRKMGFQRLNRHIADEGRTGMCMTMKKVRARLTANTLSPSHDNPGAAAPR